MRLEVLKILHDVRLACSPLVEYVAAGRTLADYERAERLIRAGIERELIIIGEALGRLRKLDPDTAKPITACIRSSGSVTSWSMVTTWSRMTCPFCCARSRG
jgi:hypothetical protein